MLVLIGMLCGVIGFATGWMARGWWSLPSTTADMIESIKADRGSKPVEHSPNRRVHWPRVAP
jgi:hypothetical protein